jgi:serine/threonine protein phosphatase 1
MDDLITFAVGDIHGCFDELADLVAGCEFVSAGRRARLIFIGDYVDRGPDSRKVLDFLIERQRREKERFVCLRGNHDDLLMRAACKSRTDSDLINWWANGGEQTLDSYGVNDPGELPTDHLAWIGSLPLMFTEQRRVFVHAGIRPGVSIADQTEQDLLWIREPFLSSDADHGALVVHGHTPTRSRLPELHANRLNLDTGACFGGTLTAALFTGAGRVPALFVNSDGHVWKPRTV